MENGDILVQNTEPIWEEHVSRFSIVIPAYDNAAYLPQCLDSLKSQTFEDWEAIVVIDASPDDSLSIAQICAGQDGRFRVLDKTVNGGPHLARKSGVELCEGDFVTFLDADDELAPDTLELLSKALPLEGNSILHFGLTCEGEGVSDEIARSFEAWANVDAPRLDRDGLMEAIFSSDSEYGKDWNVDHRVFTRGLVQKAFAEMADTRLGRAEDGYETFVLASLSDGEVTRNDIKGYRYFIGRGVTRDSSLSPEVFLAHSREMHDCSEAAKAHARAMGDEVCLESARAFERRLVFSMANDWYDRVSDDDKSATIRNLADIVGGSLVATQLMRFVRDKAYEALLAERRLTGKEVFMVWHRLAKELAASDAGLTDEYLSYSDVAESHLRNLAQRVKAKKPQPPIRIFVSTHKDVDLFESDILQPVQVGCALRERTYDWALHDDDGENISAQNPMYCELTTQYWAWKNVEADYYGFCHYRRYFDFAEERREENEWGEIIDGRIDAASQARYGLDDATITKAVEGYDVITTEVKDLREFPGDDNTPLKQYKAAKKLHFKDLEHVIAILKDMHPDYAQDADAFLNGNRSCFCNMFIMRKEIFRDYCAWLFPILARFVDETDFSTYSVEAVRTPGHLSERLFNIYLNHQLRTGANWRTKQVQCVHFEQPDRHVDVLEPPLREAKGRKLVPVVFAADDAYTPMVATTIRSMLDNACPERFYDIVVLTSNISGEHRDQMRRCLVGRLDNVWLRFHDVSGIIGEYDLKTSNEHISVETYYRFLVQRVMPYYDKVLYLDSDLIIEGDVAELFDTELGDSLLAAVRDVDYAGNLNMPDHTRINYTNRVLKMKNPYDYFQAGVLLLNARAMREAYTTKQWLEYASVPEFIYDDQDVLNAHCEGRVRFLDPSWNVMHDCGCRVGNVFSWAPAQLFNDYLTARSHPKIRHYAGFEKPWNTFDCDWSEFYWHYARETPFYEELLGKLYGQGSGAQQRLERPRPPKAISPKNPIRKFVDPLMPYGTKRREVFKAIGRSVRGLE